jgi:hypothetical protein
LPVEAEVAQTTVVAVVAVASLIQLLRFQQQPRQ